MPLPPGPSMPGLLQTAAMLSRPHGFLQRCRRRHGSVFTVHVAPYGQMVFLADPRLIRQVFTGDIHVFHVGGVRSRILSPLLGEHSLLLLDEERHMRERKLMLPAFHGEALRRYPELIREIAEAEARLLARRRAAAAAAADAGDHARGDPARGDRRARRGARSRGCDRCSAGCSTRARCCCSSSRPSSATSTGSRPAGASPSMRAQVDELIFDEIRRRRADPSGDDVLSLLVQSGGDGDDALSDVRRSATS